MTEKELTKFLKELVISLQEYRPVGKQLKVLKIEWVLIDEAVKPNITIEYE